MSLDTCVFGYVADPYLSALPPPSQRDIERRSFAHFRAGSSNLICSATRTCSTARACSLKRFLAFTASPSSASDAVSSISLRLATDSYLACLDQLYRLLFAIRAIYHAPNPYHNYVHAVDVLQATYTFLAANGVAPPVTYLLEDDREPWVRRDVDEYENEEQENARLALHSLLRPQDIFTVMIGAMGHDVGHPGLSNVFMVRTRLPVVHASCSQSLFCQKNAKTPLSQIYSDQSVLENMHCILVVQLLRKHGFGFLLTGSDRSTAETGQAVESNVAASSDSSPMSGLFPNILPATAEQQTFKREVRPGAVGDWRGFKKLLYATVLSTDMSMHFEWLKRFKDLGKRARAGICVDMAEEEEIAARTLLCQALIKCADISNPVCRRFALSSQR